MTNYTDEQWPHHCARMDRIMEARLMEEYTDVYSRLYGELIPDPSAVGDMADAAVLDDCKIEASAEVCHLHGIDQYEDVK